MPQAKWTRKPVLNENEKNKIDNFILLDQSAYNTSQVCFYIFNDSNSFLNGKDTFKI